MIKIVNNRKIAPRKKVGAGTFLFLPNCVGGTLGVIAQTGPGQLQFLVINRDDVNRKSGRISQPSDVRDLSKHEVDLLVGETDWQVVDVTITFE